MNKERDEQLKILENTFNPKPGLHFWCKALPVSKQSRDKIKKEISKQVLQNRVKNQESTSNKAKEFFDGDLELEFTFGLNKQRLGKRKNDIDNLIKHSLDCLNEVLFKDDSQIKKICASKYFVNSGVTECTGIRIYKLKNLQGNKQ